MGPLQTIMKQRGEQYNNELSDEHKQDDHRESIAFESLKVLGTLGKGSFGHVQLVRDKDGNTYALKGTRLSRSLFFR
jgi:hypothetical protein